MKHSIAKYISKRDLALILVLLSLSLIFLAGFHFLHKKEGGVVVVTVDGKTFGTFPLDQDQVIPIKNRRGVVSNKLTIKNGEAYMSHADCPDKLCMHQGRISSDGQSIVCLPNRIVCTVHSNSKNEMDGMSQ